MAEANTVTITLDRYNELLEIEKVAKSDKEYSIMSKEYDGFSSKTVRIETNDAIIKDLSDKLEGARNNQKNINEIRELTKDTMHLVRREKEENARREREQENVDKINNKYQRNMAKIIDIINRVPRRIHKKYSLSDIIWLIND